MAARHGLALAAALMGGSCDRHAMLPALPEQRPADLVVSVYDGGGWDGWWSVTIDGKGGTRRASDGTPDTRFPVTADELDGLWKTVRAAHVERIWTDEGRSVTDMATRSVTIEFGGKRYEFEGPYGLNDPKDQPRISTIDDAIMQLAASRLPGP